MKEKLLIVGTGGMAPEVVNFVQKYNLYDIVGFTVDKKYAKGQDYMEHPVFLLEDIDKHIKVGG